MHSKRLTSGAIVGLACAFGAGPAFAQGCEALSDYDLPNGSIASAEAVPAGGLTLEGREESYTVADSPAFCRVDATLTPVEGSEIGVELWLPAGEDWNGKYVAVGNGAFAGSISASAMLEPLRRGYAASSTDTGHTVADGSFGLDPVQLVDFAHRAIHEMAVASKDIIGSYYDGAPRQSYFTGCSTGGRQALTAAGRHPEDFDGIIAGAPAVRGARLHAQQIWTGLVGKTGEGADLSPEQLAQLNRAALAACDMNDGVADGVIENPLSCTVPVADAGLPEPAADTARALYRGPLSTTGEPIFYGFAPGSEAGWGALRGPEPLFVAVDFYRYFVYGDPDWSYEGFDPETAVQDAQAVTEVIGRETADLSDFFDRDGKLLMYHGWADPGISPYNSVAYYEDVLADSGAQADSVELFMVPGMGHCGGGDGPSSFDTLAALDAWVAEEMPPTRIEASRIRDGAVDRTRPLCPFPQTAVYDGSGSTDEAANFTCE